MEFLAQQTSNKGAQALAVTLVVVALTAFAFCLRRQPSGDGVATKDDGSTHDSEKIKGSVADFEKDLPVDRIFSLETLGPWDGRQLPMCIGVCGKVVDVSSSENFEPGFGYGKLWAGKDATYALAHASLKAEDANVLDYDLASWEESTVESLGSWCKHFLAKYPVVGKLEEYAGRDFSKVLPETESEDAAKPKPADSATGN